VVLKTQKSLTLLFISCIVFGMGTLTIRGADVASIDRIAQDPRVARAMDSFAKNADWITEQQIRLTEIPAPPFGEGPRGKALRKIFDSLGWDTLIDSAGNVVAERPGTGEEKQVVLLAAHIDTVFPADTPVSVKKDGQRLEGPGIADNGAGLAALVAIAKAFTDAGVHTSATVVLAGDTGEEGEGNLRGIRKLIDDYRSRLRAVIAVDGASTEHITVQGLASHRIEVKITGPGGHSWSDFGAPNPITALARGIVRFSAIRVPDPPRTTFNFGVIEGGTSVNAIPESASVKVDVRSEDEDEVARLEAALHTAMEQAVQDEMANSQPLSEGLKVAYRDLGIRPAGELPQDSFLLSAINSVDRYLGNRSRQESSSTDANIPLSMGIPALGLGGGGRGAGSHTLAEWYDPTDRALGLKRILLTTLAVAGIQP
jgi:tripeptide aminopeptidase